MLRRLVLSTFFIFSLISASDIYAQNIPMTFHNGSFSSISLAIPGVMNPNLNPKSNSGVGLNVGQVVYFFPNGKRGRREVLFVVKPNWKRDTILQIDEIVNKRIEELRKKKEDK